MASKKDIQAAERYLAKLRMIKDGNTVDPFEKKDVQEVRKARARKDVKFFVETYLKH